MEERNNKEEKTINLFDRSNLYAVKRTKVANDRFIQF